MRAAMTDGPGRIRVEEEIAATAGGLIRVGLIAVLSFTAMGWMLDPPFRPLAVVMGLVFLTAVVLGVTHLQLQRRYGTAALIAERPFEQGKPFAGTIVTGLRDVPKGPLRIRIGGWSSRRETTLARTTVDPMLLRRRADGTLVIPFHVLPPEEPVRWKPSEVRLHARAANWPIGWGASFLIAENG